MCNISRPSRKDNKMHKLLLGLLLLFPLPVIAQDLQAPDTSAPVIQPETNNSDEPDGFNPSGVEINIITQGEKTIEEYSLNGRVYMVRIQQKGFPPYYLVDRDGDGRMDEQVSEVMAQKITPPSWVLFRW